MEIFIKISQFILSFSLLVIIHELGHFMFARLFKVRVEKFYLFFNPWFSLFKFKRGGTEYGMGWVPFGGYVKIAGMIDESMDTEQMKQPAKPDEFRSKPAWQRLLIMVGGVMMNIVLAVLIYIGMSMAWGKEYIANDDLKYGYVFSEMAQEIGFENGDRIVSVNGAKIEDYIDVYPAIALEVNSQVEIDRDGQTMIITVPEKYTAKMLSASDFMTPRQLFIAQEFSKTSPAREAGMVEGDTLVAINGEPMKFFDQYVAKLSQLKGQMANITVSRDSAGVTTTRDLAVAINDEGKLGVIAQPLSAYIDVHTLNYTFFEAIPVGIKITGTELANYWRQIKLIFNPETEAYKSLGGVVTIGSIFPDYWSWYMFWRITAFLSIVLAVMNILPIPALDGGHVLFLLYEVVTRRKPSEKFLEGAQTVGLIILLALLLYANGNDIYRFFIK